MTRVSDEDLERMTMMCAVDVADDRSALLGDAIRAELLALRKVADAAAAYRDAVRVAVDKNGTWAPLISALKEAGR